MKICRVCVLDERFPRADIDAAGLCVYCREKSARGSAEDGPESAVQKFKRHIAAARTSENYDAVAAWSGGKDSTYLVWLLAKTYRLRVLAFTLDNGFLAAGAVENLKRVSEHLGIDHLMFRPAPELLKTLFVNSMKNPEAHSAKALERSSAVCASCIGLVKAVGLRLAVEKGAPLLCFGWTPGQSAASAGFVKFEAPMLLQFQQNTQKILEGLSGRNLASWFVTAEQLADPAKVPYWVHPAAFEKYDEKKIYRVIRAAGWKKPEGLDPNSTNCRLNAAAIEDHRRRFGFHPYAFELAKLVREGLIRRADALARLKWKAPQRTLRKIAGELKTPRQR